MKNISDFLSENFLFLVVKFSVYLNWHVFVMRSKAVVLVLVITSYDIVAVRCCSAF